VPENYISIDKIKEYDFIIFIVLSLMIIFSDRIVKNNIN